MNEYYVYIMTNKIMSSLYIGVTNDLMRRVYEHKNKLVDGFTEKYNLDRLVYYEIYQDISEAIKREKQLKGWTRIKKDNLINTFNIMRNDLYENIIK